MAELQQASHVTLTATKIKVNSSCIVLYIPHITIFVENKEAIKEMLSNGKTPKEIGNALGLTDLNPVYYRRRKMGLSKQKRGIGNGTKYGKLTSDPKIVEEIRKLKQEGKTYEWLGKKYGVCHQYIGQLLSVSINRSGTCSRCSQKSRRLHFHHTNYITNEGVLVCPSCHTKIHHAMKPKIEKPKPEHRPVPPRPELNTTVFISQEFGLRRGLENIRHHNAISLPKAAAKAGFSKGLWFKMENDRASNPTVNTLQRIADTFAVEFIVQRK